MKIALTGSIAFDYLMTFPGYFREHILPDRIEHISLSFLVDRMVRRPGGVAANIAYTLALLGEHPLVMATVGPDYEPQRKRLESLGVDTKGIRVIPDLFTASFFVNTDRSNAQIASFYPGAMAKASQLTFKELTRKPDLAVISPNDPGAMEQYALECSRLSIPYLYDPSQQIVRLSAEALRVGIRSCQSLFCNDYEFGLIEEKTGLDIDSILRSAEFVVITRGEEGADVHRQGEVIHIPVAPPDHIADPTGVGDAFRAGFLKGFTHGLPLAICGRMGALAATYCLEEEGPQSHRYDLPQFIERYRRHFKDDGELDALL